MKTTFCMVVDCPIGKRSVRSRIMAREHWLKKSRRVMEAAEKEAIKCDQRDGRGYSGRSMEERKEGIKSF